ncbi:MAG: hypothetical protein ACREJD_10410 [Phycisphaerales bacterium]
MHCRNVIAVSTLFAVLALPASAMLIFDELASGDLSSNPLVPTQLTVDVGLNYIDGSVDAKDSDYFTLKLPAGSSLTAIILRASSGSDATFLSFQAGSIFTEPAAGTDLRNLLGYASFFHSDLGTDLLQTLGSASDAIGFKGAPEGETFTFWINQSNPGPANFKFEFVVASEVPAPAAFAFIPAACVVFERSRRK